MKIDKGTVMSLGNRKEAEAFILEYIDKITGSQENRKIYEDLFASMSDADFDIFMKGIEDESNVLAVIAPNFGKGVLSTERNLKIAKELGHNFFQRIIIEGKDDIPTYMTPIPYMVVDLPLRRQAQLLVKKISIPEDNKTVDDFTGQPTGKSKGSKISYPEIQVLAAMGLDSCLEEMLKYRGGDTGGFIAMNKAISRSGGVSMDSIRQFSTGVESTRTLKTFLLAAHLDNTL